MLKSLPYLLPYSVPVVVLAGSLRVESWPFRAVFWIFFAVTILDTLIGDRAARGAARLNLSSSSHGCLRRVTLWMWLPAQMAVMLCGFMAVSGPARDGMGMIGIAVSVGMTGGILGMPVAHELMHGRSGCDRALAAILLTLMSYTHFCVEHVHGHHVRVGTVEDPATARLGESLYAFFFRTVSGGFANAWRIEARRLRDRGLRVFSLRNRVVRGIVVLWVLYSGIGYVSGTLGVVFFAAQSVVAFSILESINYVQHYGLSRRKTPDGRYERLMPRHSWNSGHPVSNWFVLNLGHHSDHHCHAGKTYQALAELQDAPRLPTGLFGMCVLALFPPLWRIVMDPLAVAAAKRN